MKKHPLPGALRLLVLGRSASFAWALSLAPAALAQPAGTPLYAFTTLAGSPSMGHADGAGAVAQFNDPESVAVDRAGNVYVADSLNSTIRKIDPSGVVTTFAGLAQSRGASDGAGSAARFDWPAGVAVDGAGNVYVSDRASHTVRKITPAGLVTTLAGQAYSAGAADGAGAAAQFCFPDGVAVDGAGNVYVADDGNYAIRKITPAGLVTTFAGTLKAAGAADGTGPAARFYSPMGLAIDGADNLYVTDNFTLRRISPAGVVVTVAGQAGVADSTDGTGGAARFSSPQGVGVDAAGNIYVAEGGWQTIRRITPAGVVTTFAGRTGISGSSDGPLAEARFNYPNGVAGDTDGNLYVADGFNNAIRKIRPDGTVITLAGVLPSRSAGSADGVGTAARFDLPRCVAVDAAGNVYVTDELNHTIRRVTPAGVVSTLAGMAGERGGVDGQGSAARFNLPNGITVNRAGEIFVADTGNHSIRKITPDGTVSTVAGSLDPAIWGSADGAGVTARFHHPVGVAADAAGNLYVSDDSNFTVRRIAPDGTVSTLAGRAGIAGTADGTGGDARFTDPAALALDAAGNVYVADISGSTAVIRKITAAGAVTTRSAVDSGACGLAVDSSGNVFVACTSTSSIQKMTASGVTRIAGGNLGAADGLGSAAQFYEPGGIAVDAAGVLYVADTGNNTIRVGRLIAPPAVATQPSGKTASTGQSVAFSVQADSGTPLTYRWQRQASGSATWTNLADGAGLAGTGTATLTVTASAGMNGDAFRCVVTNAAGSVTTAAATLAVAPGSPLIVATFAGQAGATGSTDGTGSAARFHAPADVAADAAGNVYVADAGNYAIRKVAPDGTVTVLAGNPVISGYADGRGTAAAFFDPTSLTVDRAGNVYVCDTEGCMIRKVTPDGAVTTLAGAPRLPGAANGSQTAARFNGPSGIVADAAGVLYVADTQNHTIRQVTTDGAATVVSTIAGSPGESGSVDGSGSAARFSHPEGLALDATGNLYVADTGNSAIRKIVLATMTVSTIAGQPGIPGSDDGPGSLARLSYPCAVAVDAAGDLYVADTDNHSIRKIAPDGVVTTVAGLPGAGGSADGVGAAARFAFPTGITANAAGNLYIADTNNQTIRIAYVPAAPVITAQPLSASVPGGASPQFSVTATGRPTPTYQWSFNGAAIAGATGSTLSLANVQPANAGSYTVTVSNASGSVTSNAAVLTVNAAATPAPAAGTGSSSGGGGGGALGLWFYGLLAPLAGARVWQRFRRRSATI